MTILILTLPPHIPGGVATKAKILADHLVRTGQDVTIGCYAARGMHPQLNVNAAGILVGRVPKTKTIEAFGGHKCVVVGCKVPELENNYTEPSDLWMDLIRSHDRHIAVGGTILVANPLVHADVRHLIWCAGDVEGDRFARRNSMNFLRKKMDAGYISQKLKDQEKAILSYNRNRILGVSPYSLEALQGACTRNQESMSVLPIPTDMDFFTPVKNSGRKNKTPILGFAGRLEDPRKNPELLFQSVSELLSRGVAVELHVTGNNSPKLESLIKDNRIEKNVKFLGRLSVDELRNFYQSLSLFIIASHQEGLAIVGIEAMACGVPVVSTKCGGPEAYIEPGRNGYISDFDANSIADRAEEILESEDVQARFSAAARSSVAETYSCDRFGANLKREWLALWDEDVEQNGFTK